ncbi:MAG: hypothetical protein L0G99_10760 [Propionibacteriales bacterium]|nr:hypothetical protein [Propionibacteriales bacterium]
MSNTTTIDSGTARPAGWAPSSNASLLGVIGGSLVASALIQIIIATVDGGHPAVWGTVMLAIVALAFVVYLTTQRTELNQRPYGFLVVHAVMFISVMLGYWAHAALRGITQQPIDLASWGAVLVIMPLCWGFGLLLHTAGSVLGKGHEHAE